MTRRLFLALILVAAIAVFSKPATFSLSLRDATSSRPYKIEIDARMLGLELGLKL